MRTIEHVSVSEFIFTMEVLDQDFDFEDEPTVTEISPDTEINFHMEDIYG